MGAALASIWYGFGTSPSLFGTMPGAKPSASVRTLEPADAAASARDRLSELMRAHGDAVYTYCARVLKDQTLAADVLQQVFEQAFRDLATLRQGRRARASLFGIAYHPCLDALKMRRRSAKRLAEEPDDMEETASDERLVSERVEAKELMVALDDCVRNLPETGRVAILLRFQEGMTYELMGTTCGEKPATLAARVARALPLLRRCLEAKGVEL